MSLAAYLFSPDFVDDTDRVRAERRAAFQQTKHAGGEESAAAERALLVRLREGDEAAFAELFRIHTPLMHRIATALLGSGDAAADVVQDVMHRLWARRVTLDVQGSFGAYLRVAIVNAARNALRGELRARRWSERMMQEMTQGPEATPLSEVTGGDMEVMASVEHDERLAAALAHAIDTLPDRTREIFLLWWGGDLTYAEIAHATGISVKGVERARARAIIHLREALRRAGHGPAETEDRG